MSRIDYTIVQIPEKLTSFRDVNGNLHENLQDAERANRLAALRLYVGKHAHSQMSEEEVAEFIIDHAGHIKEYLE